MYICEEEQRDYEEHVRRGHKGERPFFSLFVWREHRAIKTAELMRQHLPDHPHTPYWEAVASKSQLTLF